MKKASNQHTSQDYDRKHKQDHISNNPRAAKDILDTGDSGVPGKSQGIAELISKGYAVEDKRETARHEHTNHFTNREGHGEKK